MRTNVRQRALCYSSKINRSHPGGIIFIKQTSGAQDGATQNLCREIINTLAACQSQNGRQVLEGKKMIVRKIILLVFPGTGN